MSYVYVLRSLQDGKHYVGLADDVHRRFIQHNNGEVAATRGRCPLILVRTEEFSSRSEAAKREKFLKSGVGRKELKIFLNARYLLAEVSELSPEASKGRLDRLRRSRWTPANSE